MTFICAGVADGMAIIPFEIPNFLLTFPISRIVPNTGEPQTVLRCDAKESSKNPIGLIFNDGEDLNYS